MRVLYVLRYYPTLTETFVYREIRELMRRGVEVHAVAIGRRGDGVLQDELPDIEVQRPPRGVAGATLLGQLGRAVGDERCRSAWRWLRQHARAKDAARALWVGGLARRLGVHRIHAHFAGEAGEWARVAAQVADIPYSLTVHAVDLFKPRPSFGELVRDAAPVVTVSEANIGELGAHGAQAKLVRCGVDPARYPAARPDAEGPLRVIAVGRYVPKKGLDLLTEAVIRAPFEVELRLVSDAQVDHPRVVCGLVPPSEIPGLLSSAHLFALPCRVAPDGDRDGIPVALMEAMAAGLPVLTTPVSGIPELVDDEVGWLIASDDGAAVAEALASIAGAPEERRRRGAAGPGRLRDRGFTVERQVDALMAAWA